MDNYTTFNFPLEPQNPKPAGLKIKPLYNLNELGLPKKDIHAFMNILWYGIQLPQHSLTKRIKAFLRRKQLPNLRLEYHILIRNCSYELKEELLALQGVSVIDTPDWYIKKFEEEDAKRKKKLHNPR